MSAVLSQSVPSVAPYLPSVTTLKSPEVLVNDATDEEMDIDTSVTYSDTMLPVKVAKQSQSKTPPYGTIAMDLPGSSDDLTQPDSDVEGKISIFAKKGVAMPFTIDLDAEKAVPDTPSLTSDGGDTSYDGSIVWEALVYDAERELSPSSFSSCAVVRYTTKKPIESLVLLSKKNSSNAKDGLEDSLEASIKWSGPSFHMRYQAQARMPWLECTRPENDRKPLTGCNCSSCEEARKSIGQSQAVIHNESRIPRSPGDHEITSCQQAALVIKSPHLYMELNEIVEHYPGYVNASGCIQPSKHWEAVVAYPYAFLLHHFPLIEDRALLPAELETPKERRMSAGENAESLTSHSKFEKDATIARAQLKVLKQYLEPIYESMVLPCQKALKDKVPKITFDMLWYILKPGTLVYVRDEWTPWYVARINKVDISIGSLGNEIMEVSLWTLSSDGARIGRFAPTSPRVINSYDGVKEVSSLDICPTEYWDKQDGGARRQEAIKRGKILEKAFRNGHLLATYTSTDGFHDLGSGGKVVIDHRRGQDMTGLWLHAVGLAEDEKDIYSSYDEIYVNEPWNWGPEGTLLKEAQAKHNSNDAPHDVPSDPYADPYTSRKKSRKSMPLNAMDIQDSTYATRWTSVSRKDKGLSPNLSDEQLMLIYPLTFGFSLKTKLWIEIDASRLEEIAPSKDTMRNLVLAPDTMRTIEALASRLKKPDTWSADHIKGKGSGGIILLHGPPGVGKTFTVECIAELLQRPLLALTVADIGTAETMIEHELSRWFALADLWKAVLLIDEADIFLEKRQTKDLQRNGLVSAFLRRAEYFSGLLFLTTNRVGQIDDAFISRIHVPIHYKPLSGEDLARIWDGFFRKLSGDKSVRIRVDPLAKKWVMSKFVSGNYSGLNGRDIRNALQTAITLAAFEYEELEDTEDFDKETDMITVTQQHFEKVLVMSHDFRSYVDGIRKEDEAKRASLRGDRNDYPETKQSVLGNRR